MSLTRPLLVAALAVVAVSPLAAQGRGMPDSLVNTKVFPHETPMREVLNAMRGFTASLGVRCDYCHVEGQAGGPVGPDGRPELNFPSDDKRTKRTARMMMLMVRQINDSVLSRIPERPAQAVAVTCTTCHRGVSRPEPLADERRGEVLAAHVEPVRHLPEQRQAELEDLFVARSGQHERAACYAAFPVEIAVGGAGQASLELVGAPSEEREMGMAIDEAGDDAATIEFPGTAAEPLGRPYVGDEPVLPSQCGRGEGGQLA